MARHNYLMALLQGSSWATDDVLARLRSLEAEGPAAGPPLWESVVMSSGAADDERVIEASRRVWEALGPNAYAVQFKPRPQTWRGFLEGRRWLVVGMAGLVVIAILADEVNQRWGWYWLLLLPLFITWPALRASHDGLRLHFLRHHLRLGAEDFSRPAAPPAADHGK